MRILNMAGVATALLLIGVCFLPWTYHADLQKNFTGFFSEKQAYGRPGIFIILFSLLYMVMLIINKTWSKRVLLFVAALALSYAIKTYVLYTSCYNAYCPEKKAGIFLELLLPIAMLIISLLVYNEKKKNLN
ncbi:MAG: hypothetical protein ABIT96_08985 [Ferruginibacter sp.]